VSLLEESPVQFGETKKSDLAVSISSNFSKADAQTSRPRVSDVPTRDTGGFNVGSNLRPVSVIDPRGDQGSYRTLAAICG
jgi:hypothetical protein